MKIVYFYNVQKEFKNFLIFFHLIIIRTFTLCFFAMQQFHEYLKISIDLHLIYIK